MRRWVLILGLLAALPMGGAPREETRGEARLRHEQVAGRRVGVGIICHRGASQFAHENTLEAYRATFELGGDGNEIDIRATRDGVLVCFHDDTIEARLTGFGGISDYTLAELRRLKFRESGPFGSACAIPTLVEVFELHRRYGGLLHLDIKQAGIDAAVVRLLDQMDMWDQVAHCNTDNAAAVLGHSSYHPRRYKGELYERHAELDPEAVAAMLKLAGDDIIVDDPRGVALALRRTIGKVSRTPVIPQSDAKNEKPEALPSTGELLATLRDSADWDHVSGTAEDQAVSARRILARARAADLLMERGNATDDVFRALEDRVRRRSLHKDWRFHGVDGEIALRSLVLLHAPGAVRLARECVWRDDPALERVRDPKYDLPRAWTDFRIKEAAFPALEHCEGAETEKLCRDYLALSDAEAKELGPPLFDAAAKTLLIVSPRTETAVELIHHRLQVVRGRAILQCLVHAREPWAHEALERAAPYALKYVPPG
jgi:hypothetical protein